MTARFVRVAETARKTFGITVDGDTVQAAEGDTLLVILSRKLSRIRPARAVAGRPYARPGTSESACAAESAKSNGRQSTCATVVWDGGMIQRARQQRFLPQSIARVSPG